MVSLTMRFKKGMFVFLQSIKISTSEFREFSRTALRVMLEALSESAD
jgi:hypothetical protein